MAKKPEGKNNCTICKKLKQGKCRAHKLVTKIRLKDNRLLELLETDETPCGGQDFLEDT